MRAVRYGVTRHQVLGVEAVLGTGEVIRTGGKFVKATTGYDLTQLIIGSEGTLAVVTEAILRLHPRQAHAATVLAPFRTIEAVARRRASDRGQRRRPTHPRVHRRAVDGRRSREPPGSISASPRRRRPRRSPISSSCSRTARAERLDEDVAEVAELLGDCGALDVYVLPSGAGAPLIEAREKAFWTAKAAGADDIIDMVVPRASIPEYLAAVSDARAVDAAR